MWSDVTGRNIPETSTLNGEGLLKLADNKNTYGRMHNKYVHNWNKDTWFYKAVKDIVACVMHTKYDRHKCVIYSSILTPLVVAMIVMLAAAWWICTWPSTMQDGVGIGSCESFPKDMIALRYSPSATKIRFLMRLCLPHIQITIKCLTIDWEKMKYAYR